MKTAKDELAVQEKAQHSEINTEKSLVLPYLSEKTVLQWYVQTAEFMKEIHSVNLQVMDGKEEVKVPGGLLVTAIMEREKHGRSDPRVRVPTMLSMFENGG